MAISPETTIFLDTNVITGTRIGAALAPILDACRSGDVKVCISEWVVWENSRQYLKNQQEQLVDLAGAMTQLHRMSERELLVAYHDFFKRLFQSYDVDVVDHNQELMDVAENLIQEEDTYFSETDKHDHRDAMILAAALQKLPPANTVVFCLDKSLAQEFSSRGYSVLDDIQEFVAEHFSDRKAARLEVPNIAEILRSRRGASFPPEFHDALLRVDDKYRDLHLEDEPSQGIPILNTQQAESRLARMSDEDDEVRRLVLSRVHWFDPITRSDLYELLKGNGVSEQQAEYAVALLAKSGSIKEIGSHVASSGDGLCEAIAASRIADLGELLSGQ